MKNISIYIENERLDLFEDENIIINSSVQNIQDISKVFTDYSQSFSVPASQKNNRIFRHYYNQDITNGFDARVKRQGKIEIATLPFREGKIRLEGVLMKNGKPESYKITFFGNLVSLADLFGEDTLKDLDLSLYNHEYDAGTIRTAFDAEDYDNGVSNTGLFFDTLVYVPISPQRRFLYNQSSTNSLDVATQPIKIEDLTLGMRVSTILERIALKYDISFSDHVINDTGTLSRLYMSLGNTDEGVILRASDDVLLTSKYTQRVDYDGIHEGQSYEYHSLKVIPRVGYEDVTYTITAKDVTNNESTSKTITGEGGFGLGLRSKDFDTLPQQREVEFYVNADKPFFFDAEVWHTLERYIEINPPTLTRSYSTTKVTDLTSENIAVEVIVAENMPDMKVKDFVTGIINAFNLVIIPTSDTSYYVNFLNNWYLEGKVEDITPYVSIENVDISGQGFLSEINFEFEEPSTLLALNFFNQTGRYYGNLKHIVTDSSGEKVDGEEFSVKLPFEQMVYERLYDGVTNDLTNFQYGYKVDEELERTETKPILFFSSHTGLGDYPIQIDNGSGGTKTVTECRLPFVSNMQFSDPAKRQSITFGSDTDTYTQSPVINSLYSLYWEDYITDIFSPKRRLFKYTAKLPHHLLTRLKLNDKVIVKGTRHIINKMEINLTDNTTQLELLNDIY